MSAIVVRCLAPIIVAIMIAPPVMAVSSAKAVSIALNDLALTDDGVILRNPRHTARWDRDGLAFSAAGGPVWRWKLSSVCAGDKAVELDADATPVAAKESLRVDFDRGSFIERYIARPAAIEQQFVLIRPLSSEPADLVIEGTIATAGEWSVAEKGWVWSSARGVVSLGKVTVFDADGNTVPARMEVSAETTRIIVDGGALSSAAYPVTIDPEIGTNDFRISDMGTNGNTNESALQPAVAYNSTNNQFLVVWQGLEGVQNEIYGQRIDALTGAEVGTNDFRISDMGDETATFSANGPAVAYNKTNNEYLVVWRGDDNVGGLVDNETEIFGQRINAATGADAGTNDFRISNMGTNGVAAVDGGGETDWPSVAWNSAGNEYLVVWHGTHARSERVTEIFGQRLNGATGAEVGTNDFIITDFNPPPATFRNALEPKVAYNSTNNEYLVVWYGENLNDNEVDIFGQRLNAASGVEVGSNDFQISDMGPNGDTGYRGDSADVVYNATRNEYLVVWAGSDDTLPAGEREIFAQRINAATGAEVGINDYRISDMGPAGNTMFEPIGPEVTYSPITRHYLVVWSGADTTAFATEVHGQVLNVVGLEWDVNDFRLSDMGANDADTNYQTGDPGVAYGSAGITLVVWRSDDDTPPLVNEEVEIFGQRYLFPPVYGDLSDDDNVDIVLRNYSTGQNALWLMSGTTLGSVFDLPALPNTSYRIEGTADFDADGSADIVLRNYATGQDALWLMTGVNLSSIVDLPALPNTAYHFEGTGDFNGDGKPDIVLRNYTTGQNALWLMNGTALSSIVDLPALPNTSYRIECTGDFNSDGQTDIVLRNYTTGQNAVWLMNGTAITSVVDLPALANVNYRFDGVGDMNRDGKPDIVLRNYSTGQNAVWLMNGTAVSSVVDLPALPNVNYEINGPR